jgi:hypothetical protein
MTVSHALDCEVLDRHRARRLNHARVAAEELAADAADAAERRDRMAVGAILAGYQYRHVSEASGVPMTTLHRLARPAVAARQLRAAIATAEDRAGRLEYQGGPRRLEWADKLRASLAVWRPELDALEKQAVDVLRQRHTI